jgi:hypothetical protein
MKGRLDRTVLTVGVLLLALGPLVVTLLRAEDYGSTTTISLNPANPTVAYFPDLGSLVSGPVDVTDVQRRVAREVDWFDTPRDLPDYVSVSERGTAERRQFLVLARGPSPEEAAELARVSSRSLLDAAETGATFTQPLQLKRIAAALGRGDQTAEERARLQQRRREVSASISGGEPIFAAQPQAPSLESERVGDRLLGALPGDRPLRPNLLWALVAGLVLAGVLVLCVAVLSPAGSRRPGE